MESIYASKEAASVILNGRVSYCHNRPNDVRVNVDKHQGDGAAVPAAVPVRDLDSIKVAIHSLAANISLS
jgi:hypothetical protein